MMAKFKYLNDSKSYGDAKVKIKVEKSAKIPDGKYQGAIINIRYRNRKFSYVDLEIEFMHKEESRKLKAGYPATITESSKLGRLLSRFKINLEVDEEIDPDVLIGKPCLFDVFTEVNEKGSFSRINTDSIRLFRKQKQIMEENGTNKIQESSTAN